MQISASILHQKFAVVHCATMLLPLQSSLKLPRKTRVASIPTHIKLVTAVAVVFFTGFYFAIALCRRDSPSPSPDLWTLQPTEPAAALRSEEPNGTVSQKEEPATPVAAAEARLLPALHQEEHAAAKVSSPFCHLWEVDTDEWWTHHVDWEISLENATHYCFSPIQVEEKAKLFRHLYDIQMSPTAICSKATTTIMGTAGWGAEISIVMANLKYGIKHLHPVQAGLKQHPVWKYAALYNGSMATCPSKNIFCYYLNLTHCPPNPERETPWEGAGNHISDRWLVQYITRPQTWLRHAAYDFTNKHLMIHRASSAASNNTNATMPVTATSSEARSTSNLLALDRITKEQVPIDSCIVIHVRRSDVVLENRRYYTISEYLDELWNQTSHKPSDNPYFLLLTDDANAIGEALALHRQYNWMYFDRPRYRGSEGGWDSHFPSGSPKAEVVAIHAITRVVRQCATTFVYSTGGMGQYLCGVAMSNRNAENKTDAEMCFSLIRNGRVAMKPGFNESVSISKDYLQEQKEK